uniref:Uncharacterized protein n=1 Tax=Steinernema glaseri TaxID=37863 RepID=A0A1I7YWQ2_9BILA
MARLSVLLLLSAFVAFSICSPLHPEFGYQVVSEDTIDLLGASESTFSLPNAKVDHELKTKDLKSCWMKNIGVH